MEMDSLPFQRLDVDHNGYVQASEGIVEAHVDSLSD